jgi:nucleotide-binding universal stress UspA family protein
LEKLTHILLAPGPDPGAKILEKAVRLARHFGARVEVLLEETADSKAIAALCNTRGYDEVMLSSVFRGAASLPDLILRHVYKRSPDLLIKPQSGTEASAGGFAADDRELAAACPIPLCLMRARAWRSPPRIAAAIDVSNEHAALARGIVHAAGFFNLAFEGELDVVYSEREKTDEVLRMARAVSFARLAREFHVSGSRLRHLDGDPEQTLPPLAASGKYDLLVLGAVSHRTGLSALHASLTRRLVCAFEGDVLLVKETANASSERERPALKLSAVL